MIEEVLAVGDATFQKKCPEKMGHVAQEGERCCSSSIIWV